MAGGRWPGLARAAILADLGEADDDELGQQLLEDIRTIFDELADDRRRPAGAAAAEQVICTALHEMADRPWCEMGRNETPIMQNKLARLLKQFGIAPIGSIWLPGGKSPKGYKCEGLDVLGERPCRPLGPSPSEA